MMDRDAWLSESEAAVAYGYLPSASAWVLAPETFPDRRASRILSFFTEGTPCEANPDSQLAPEHRARIERGLRQGTKLQFVLPAFPAKSPNRDKTIGDLPDLAEVLALRRLDRICGRIAELHAPGAEIIICSDGRVFSDLVGVPDETVTAYSRAIEAIIEDEALRNIRTFHLENVFDELDHDGMRERLNHRYAQSGEQVRDRVKAEEGARRLFNGMHRFVFEDRVGMRPGASRERVRNESKDIAYELLRRSDAWGSLVAQAFPRAVRLSIHPQMERSSKIAVRLLPSEDCWRTPWHSALLIQNGQAALARRSEALLCGAELREWKGRYPFFVLNSSDREVAHALG